MKRIEIRFTVTANGALIAAFDKRADADAWIDARAQAHPDVGYVLRDGLSRGNAIVYRREYGAYN